MSYVEYQYSDKISYSVDIPYSYSDWIPYFLPRFARIAGGVAFDPPIEIPRGVLPSFEGGRFADEWNARGEFPKARSDLDSTERAIHQDVKSGLQEEAEAWSKLVADVKAEMDARLVPIVGNISALEGRNRSTYDSFFAMPQILADRAAALLETARTDAASLQSAREAEDVDLVQIKE